ncbi:MAG: ROK family protein [Herpetosiphon sp.]|nr:ROK family protein [Herpetosiphon sp.]
MEYSIGVDLGGTHLRSALVDQQGKIVAHERVRTHGEEGVEAVIGRIVGLIKKMEANDPNALIRGVGVAAPGPINPFTGMVSTLPNIPGFENFALRDTIQKHLDYPVVIGNDANLAAVGEWLFGGGRSMKNLIYVTISTGIGGGIIADGKLLLGNSGFAAEVGHIILQPDGPDLDTPTPIGSWEALASGTALARMARTGLYNQVDTVLEAMATPETITTRHIAEAATSGDAFANHLIDQAGRWTGIAFVNLLHLFSPEAIFIGGGVSNLGDRLLNPAREEIQRRALPAYRNVPLILTNLGDNIGLLGAAAYAFDQIPAEH